MRPDDLNAVDSFVDEAEEWLRLTPVERLLESDQL